MEQHRTASTMDNAGKLDGVDCERIGRIVNKHRQDSGALIAILEEIQTEYGYLSEEALRIVSQTTGCSLVDVYGVATFYRSFSLRPKGRHHVCACLGTACHVRGAPRVVRELERQLRIPAGETTPDLQFTLETVNCLGACAIGPVVVIDGHYFARVKESRLGQLLEQALKGFNVIEVGKDERIFPIEVNCPHCNRSLMDESFALDGYPSIRVTICSGRQDGWLRLSCLYGSYSFSSELTIPTGVIVKFQCPHCRVELPSTSNCSLCAAPMVPMLVYGGGIVQICSRRGCQHHMLDLI